MIFQTIPQLSKTNLSFPNINEAHESGLLAIGGDLSTKRLLKAYKHGIFPWFDDLPIKWYAPSNRMILFVNEAHFSKSLLKLIKKNEFIIKFDNDFKQTISSCRQSYLKEGTWISQEMITSYNKLFEQGFAHSVEVWRNEKLVGGLYGVLVNNIFSGESMFHVENNASKIAMFYLIQKLKSLNINLIDSQVYTENIARYGGFEITRVNYMKLLNKNKQNLEIIGQWESNFIKGNSEAITEN